MSGGEWNVGRGGGGVGGRRGDFRSRVEKFRLRWMMRRRHTGRRIFLGGDVGLSRDGCALQPSGSKVREEKEETETRTS